jgi:hypothetical protein
MKGWVTTLLVLSVTSVIASAQTQLPWYVVSSGGEVGAVSGGRVLSGTIGQTIIGVSKLTPGNELSQGFWLPIINTTSVDEGAPIDYSSSVSNYPNPFSYTTTIRFGTPIEGAVTVRVFDMVGNLVRTLQADVSLSGAQEIQLTALDENGAPLADGAYLYEVTGRNIEGQRIRSVQRLTVLH